MGQVLNRHHFWATQIIRLSCTIASWQCIHQGSRQLGHLFSQAEDVKLFPAHYMYIELQKRTHNGWILWSLQTRALIGHLCWMKAYLFKNKSWRPKSTQGRKMVASGKISRTTCSPSAWLLVRLCIVLQQPNLRSWESRRRIWACSGTRHMDETLNATFLGSLVSLKN